MLCYIIIMIDGVKYTPYYCMDHGWQLDVFIGDKYKSKVNTRDIPDILLVVNKLQKHFTMEITNAPD